MHGNRPGLIAGSSKTGRAKHKAWRAAVKAAAEQVRADEPYDGPLGITIDFRFPMPKSRPAPLKRLGIGWHTVKPDTDKVLRATLDGLSDGLLIVDDARICRFHITAVETTGTPGAQIVLHQLDPIRPDLAVAA